MTPSARVQAAIELLDAVITAMRDDGASADAIAKRFFAGRRYAGSKDRRAIRELAYRAIRRCGERPETGRAAMLGLTADEPDLAALFDGSPYGPAPIAPEEPVAKVGFCPDWLAPLFAEPVDDAEREALLDRAPLDIRWREGQVSLSDLEQRWPEAQALAIAGAARLPAGTPLEQDDLHRSGAVEIQDLGSQAIVAAAVRDGPATVLDLCAGAGGKTLALRAALPDAGIIAADTDRRRLGELRRRAERAGDTAIDIRLLDPKRETEALNDLVGQCDLVLVDAPCSGTGTWRRNPELRWRMTPQRLARTEDMQARLLDLASDYVRPGGLLSYAVCSLLDREGGDRIGAFLDVKKDWSSESADLPLGRDWRKGRLLTPYHDGTDGFFFAHLRKAC